MILNTLLLVAVIILAMSFTLYGVIAIIIGYWDLAGVVTLPATLLWWFANNLSGFNFGEKVKNTIVKAKKGFLYFFKA